MSAGTEPDQELRDALERAAFLAVKLVEVTAERDSAVVTSQWYLAAYTRLRGSVTDAELRLRAADHHIIAAADRFDAAAGRLAAAATATAAASPSTVMRDMTWSP